MNSDIERYAYVDFTGQSYINQHGIPTNRPDKYTIQPIDRNRTIIRTITPNCCIHPGVPTNGWDKMRSQGNSNSVWHDYALVGTNLVPKN